LCRSSTSPCRWPHTPRRQMHPYPFFCFQMRNPEQAFLPDCYVMFQGITQFGQAVFSLHPFCAHFVHLFEPIQLYPEMEISSTAYNHILPLFLSKNPHLHLCRFLSPFFYPYLGKRMDFGHQVCYTGINDDRGGTLRWQKAK
jgi:hypothetical protein